MPANRVSPPTSSVREDLVQPVADDRERLAGPPCGLELVQEALLRQRAVPAHRRRLLQLEHAGVVQEERVRVELRVRERGGLVPVRGRVERGRPVVVALRVLVPAVRGARRQDREVRRRAEADPHVRPAGPGAAVRRRRDAAAAGRVRAVARGEHDVVVEQRPGAGEPGPGIVEARVGLVRHEEQQLADVRMGAVVRLPVRDGSAPAPPTPAAPPAPTPPRPGLVCARPLPPLAVPRSGRSSRVPPMTQPAPSAPIQDQMPAGRLGESLGVGRANPCPSSDSTPSTSRPIRATCATPPCTPSRPASTRSCAPTTSRRGAAARATPA